MDGPYYTLGSWRVKPGQQDAFAEAWLAVGDVFADLPGSRPIWGTLIQSLEDPQVFYSFGPWPDLEGIERMREDADAKEALELLVELCEQAQPGAYRRVEHVVTSETRT